MVLFMRQAIPRDRALLNWPLKPEGQPANVQIREPEPANILTAMAENKAWCRGDRMIQSERQSPSRGSSILWAMYTNPYTLHSYSLLTIRQTRQARNEICVRVTQAGQPMDLHRFLGRGDYLKLESDTVAKRVHGAPKPPGVSAESARRTWKRL